MTPANSKTIREETLMDVPTSELDAISSQFVAAGATVKAIHQDNGKWTVVASFEEAP